MLDKNSWCSHISAKFSRYHAAKFQRVLSKPLTRFCIDRFNAFLNSIEGFMFRILMQFTWLLCSSFSVLASQNAAVMVTGLAGSVTENGKVLPLFSELPTNTELKLAPNSKVTLVLFANGQEYSVKGPGTVAIKSDSIALDKQVIAGKALLASTDGLNLAPKNFDQAATIMRGETAAASQKIKLIYPLGGVLLEPAPSFKWTAPKPGLQYRIQIFNQLGDSLFVTQTQQTEVKLPENLKLPRDEQLSWVLEANVGDQVLSNTADFKLASPALTERLGTLLTAKNPSVSQMALYAKILENYGLLHAAENYRKKMRSNTN